MENKGSLAPVIKIDEEKCINCYACITACPVKYCMDGSGETLGINKDLCIGCGNCITVCTHKARKMIDDTKQFLDDLKKGVKIIAIVAPAVASVFPGKYLNLNGYLKSLGVKEVFDVSFGAELTVYSYVELIKKKRPKLMIAQPCPSIVSFIEIYHPELLPYLSTAESPMLHSIKMIREYYRQYDDYKIAVISPCIAKKREFDETKSGDYNVTMLAIKEYIEEQGITLSGYPSTEYMGVLAERGVMFPTPGGLLDTAERFVPGIRRITRKIEGVHTIYPYLKEVSEDLNKPEIAFPALVDCLNCEKGCVGGPGTGNSHKSTDELESPVRKRSAELEKKLNPKQQERLFKKYNREIGRYWKPGLYQRSYVNLSGNNTIKHPNDSELKEVYRCMKKDSEADIYDCTACGYGSCKSMATAIFNKLNKPENCAHYNLGMLGEEKKTIVFINQQLKGHISRALGVIESINDLLNKLDGSINIQTNSVNDSSAVTVEMLDSLKNTSELSRHKRESIMALIDNAAKGQQAMRDTVQSVKDISESIDGIASAIKIISVIASNTNLLSMNAAIEAAHAGESGKGFAVVADEIRRLSETTRENSRSISQTLSNIITGITVTTKRSTDTGNLINGMSSEIDSFATTMTQLIDTLGTLASESSGITSSLESLKENSKAVKTDCTEMVGLTDKLRYDINFLAAMSADIVRAIENNDREIIEKLLAIEETREAAK
ncbi:MAG: methyl-accepting chemotaxis protein [Treponema sp.]|jgi:iron only hydrogenase large subunit-like protein/ABC-type transporter Mla subunit MlaD|nr:methyl-accepting chemotaxis protein [Treponema sp.]